MTCASKSCIFEVWINRVVHYCKIWRLCRKLHHSGVKEFFHVSNCFTTGMYCSIILLKTSFGSSSCNLLRKGSNKSLRYLAAITVWLKNIGPMIRLLQTASPTPILCGYKRVSASSWGLSVEDIFMFCLFKHRER
jgi:hypothetical protein